MHSAMMQPATRLITPHHTNLHDYSITEASGLSVRFPILANPVLALYVFPHISDGVAVPGYITTYTLYEGSVFALPGEQ